MRTTLVPNDDRIYILLIGDLFCNGNQHVVLGPGGMYHVVECDCSTTRCARHSEEICDAIATKVVLD